MAFTSKNIVIKLNKGETLNGDNYELWSKKIQYMQKEQKALEVLNFVLDEPEARNIAQQKYIELCNSKMASSC